MPIKTTAFSPYQNNLFFNTLETINHVYYQDISTYYSTSQFNAQNGVDGNTIANNISGDPLFTDLANEDFSPQITSPAVNAGIDVGLTVDYLLNPRVVGPASDIGPLETGVGNPLAVELSQYGADVLKNNKVKLFWQTLSEIESERFEIERKSEKEDWKKIGEIVAKGNSNQTVDYFFIDQNPPNGVLYYRLWQIDLDGKFEYSEIVSCEIKTESKLKLARLNSSSLEIISPENWDWTKTEIQIIDSAGKTWSTISGKSEINIDKLANGIYFLLVKKENLIEVFKFQK